MKKLLLFLTCFFLTCGQVSASYVYSPEADTLDAVTDRGATTTNAVTVGGVVSSGNVQIGNSGTAKQLDFTDTDIAHGVTGTLATDSYAVIKEVSAAGSVSFIGATTAAANSGMYIEGIMVSDPTDSIPAISLKGLAANGTGRKALGAAETVLEVYNLSTALFEILGSGQGVFHVSVKAADYYSGDGTQGATTTCADGTSLTVKDGLVTACS